MARYEDDYHWRSYRGFSMRPEPVRGESLDPNYRGGDYQGMRMGGGQPNQAAYGRWRLDHERDLGGSGGFQGYEDREWRLRPDTGTYEPAPGHVQRPDRGHDPRDEYNWRGYEPQPGRGYDRGYDRGQRTVENGGVQGDNRYLRQYNAASPALRGGQAYDRSYGHAEGAPGRRPGQGPSDRDRFQRDANRYGGYSSGGFGERWLPKNHP